MELRPDFLAVLEDRRLVQLPRLRVRRIVVELLLLNVELLILNEQLFILIEFIFVPFHVSHPHIFMNLDILQNLVLRLQVPLPPL